MQKAIEEVENNSDGVLGEDTQEQIDYDNASTLGTQVEEVDKVDLPERLISSKPEEAIDESFSVDAFSDTLESVRLILKKN